MTISEQFGPFEARINESLLQVSRDRQALFTCRLDTQSGFVARSDGLYAHDALTPLYRGGDAAQLLSCLTAAMGEREMVRAKIRGSLVGIGVIVTALLALVTLGGGWSATDPLLTRPGGLEQVSPPPFALSRSAPAAPADSEIHPMDVPALPAPPKTVEPVVAPRLAEGWSLSATARAALPERLNKAAARGLFTVPLSSGHARTLYVFADPLCANCQRMARHYAAASARVNVVIFPVTIEGRADSLAALTPVMALPEAQRAAAWTSLFSADTGVGVPGSTPDTAVDTTQAELARGAIGVNEVAFRAYRIPGTPWTVTDDGRYVPQAVLRSPDALDEFLNAEGANGR